MNSSCAPGCLCECCVGIERRTPRSVANPQGRDSLRYRVGEYGDFIQSMIAELSTISVRTDDLIETDALLGGAFNSSLISQTNLPQNPLAALKTRSMDDPTIAMLDAWSIVLHILTFYSERIVNEGYLRTATEYRSVLELARLVGYNLRPGVSAGTYLAYTLEKDHALTIKAGSKAQNIPESGQLPQTFETSNDFKADFRWNNLIPRRARPQIFEPGLTTAGRRVFFEGLNTQLKVNDPLLVVFDGSKGEPFRVRKVLPDNPAQRTMIVLSDFSSSPLLVEAAPAVGVVKRLFVEYRQALEKSEEFAAVSDGLTTFRTHVQAVQVLLDGFPTASGVVALELRKLIDNLGPPRDALNDALKNLQLNAYQSLPGMPTRAEAYVRFEDFLVQLDMLIDYLTVQWVALFAAKNGAFRSATDLNDTAADLKSSWDDKTIRSMSAITLCNLFQSTLDNLETGKHSAERVETQMLLGAVVRSILRSLIDRLTTVSQAGVSTDTRLSRQAWCTLRRLRAKFKFEFTREVVESQLNLAVSELNRQMRALYRARPESQFVVAIQTGAAKLDEAGADINQIVLAAQQSIKDFLDYQTKYTTFVLALQKLSTTGESSHRLPCRQAAEACELPEFSVALDEVPATKDTNIAFCKIWKSTVLDVQGIDDLHKKLITLSDPIGALDTGTADLAAAKAAFAAFLTEIDSVLRVPLDLVADLPFQFDGEALSHLRTSIDLRLQFKHFATSALHLSQAQENLNDRTISPFAAIAILLTQLDLVRTKIVLARPTIDAVTSALSRILPTIDGKVVPPNGDKYRVSELNHLRSSISSVTLPGTTEFVRLAHALTELGTLIPSTAAKADNEELPVPALTIGGQLWLRAAPDALAVLQRLEQVVGTSAAPFEAAASLEALENVMPRLRQVARQVSAGNYPRIGPWIDLVLETLDQFASDLLVKPHASGQLDKPVDAAAELGGVCTDDDGHDLVDLTALRRQAPMPPSEIARTPLRLTQAGDATTDQSSSQQLLNDLAVQLAGDLGSNSSEVVYSAIENSTSLRRRRFQALHVLRAKAGPFGHNFSPRMVLKADGTPDIDTVTTHLPKTAEWPLITGLSPSHGLNVLLLDTPNDKVVVGSFVVVERANTAASLTLDNPLVARVDAIATVSASGYGLPTTRVTQLTLDRPWLSDDDVTGNVSRLSNVVVYLQSEPLELAGEPYDADVGPLFEGDRNASVIELDSVVPGLRAGQWIVVSGERTDVPGTSGINGSELALIGGTSQAGDVPNSAGQGLPHTVLHLAQPLTYSYQRQKVTIYGNVVKADHGETKAEVLGSGDARVAGQVFGLKQRPLTHLSAPTASGTESTLKVRVNGVLWHPAPRGAELGPNDRQYVTQIDADDKVNVLFAGARVPSGTDNVRAEYRIGTGSAANLPTGKISQLVSRPLGVKDVTNPLPSTGGADRESTDHARLNAPLGVTSLDRLVSVSDYADFARAYAGIEKSYATRLSDGFVQRLHLTVAGQRGEEIPSSSDLFQNLVLALRKLGDPLLPLTVANRWLRLIVLAVRIKVHPDYEFLPVRDAARKRLLDQFGFENRDFGQDVVLSEFMLAIQSIPGVMGVVIDAFGTISERKDEDGSLKSLTDIKDELSQIASGKEIPDRIPIWRTRRTQSGIQQAQIAYFSPRVEQTLILNEVL